MFYSDLSQPIGETVLDALFSLKNGNTLRITADRWCNSEDGVNNYKGSRWIICKEYDQNKNCIQCKCFSQPKYSRTILSSLIQDCLEELSVDDENNAFSIKSIGSVEMGTLDDLGYPDSENYK